MQITSIMKKLNPLKELKALKVITIEAAALIKWYDL